jgi:hypothetical protein
MTALIERHVRTPPWRSFIAKSYNSLNLYYSDNMLSIVHLETKKMNLQRTVQEEEPSGSDHAATLAIGTCDREHTVCSWCNDAFRCNKFDKEVY